MGSIATYQEVYDLLEQTPAASLAWVDGIVAARLSLQATAKFVETMANDADSPLRAMENEVLGEEIRKLNVACGTQGLTRAIANKNVVKVNAVLSPAEQQRVTRIVAGFCQPAFNTSKRYGKNGHAVMNAVRRVLTGYCMTKVPTGASVVEVGPDVTSWILSPSPSAWAGDRIGAYAASRPTLTPRDGVRMTWARLAAEVVQARAHFYGSEISEKARIFKEMRQRVFVDAAVPTDQVAGEYMLSFDSNYDIKFSDMPVAMALAGARAWYGTMVRAKGLTSSTKLKEGKLPMMGVNYRVDWKAGRIDFRHPECNAFGYSHDVNEYVKYEERHGYTWSTSEFDYIYTKGPETTDELLFFSVVRVPKLHRMYEPRFTENPRAGMLRLHSLWGDGEERGGVPTRFSAVDFHVDALNFWKVLEKRRALDHKGDISVSLSLVRSTNVRFYMHGTPIGANEQITARLAPATAIVVEAMVHEQRLRDNDLFDVAMYQFDMSNAATSWLSKLLASVIDMKIVTGRVISSILRTWGDIRSSVIDSIISPLTQVKVGCELVAPHVMLECNNHELTSYGGRIMQVESECGCAEIADLRAAIACTDDEARRQVFEKFLEDQIENNKCTLCISPDLVDAQDTNSSDSDVSFSVIDGSEDSEDTTISEISEERDDITDNTFDEFVSLETYLLDNNLRECRIDYDTIVRSGPLTEATAIACTTGRTRHALLQFSGGACIRVMGEHATYSAMYDPIRSDIVTLRVRGEAMFADVRDGVYYSCNRMEVWNAPSLIAAIEHAKVYGNIRTPRASYHVTLGVPGAGKTYMMMKDIASKWKSKKNFSFLVLAVTNESVKAAIRYGEQFDMDLDCLESRVMTLDKYLMHKRFPADFLCVDEFPMVHMAKVDAAVALSSAASVHLYGDAKQIPYDPFCAEFKLEFSTIGETITESRVNFLPMTHRLSRDVCAMWIDQYPMIYPCDCCNLDVKQQVTLSYEKVSDISHMRFDEEIRYHTYLRDDRDDLRVQLQMRETKEQLRAKKKGGLATVHEDQGSTHQQVVTVRLTADYDKNASKRNPSLFNRLRYVLTDTTRHVKSYHYVTLSEEFDLVCQRIDMSKEKNRLKAVDDKSSFANVTIASMLK